MSPRDKDKSVSPKAKSKFDAIHPQISKMDKLEVPHDVSNECREVIELMLKKDPEERVSLFELLHHPWLHDFQHLNKQVWEETSNESASDCSKASNDGGSDKERR